MALAILALGLIAALGLCSSSVLRVDKAEKRWRTQHMLTQGAEYFLLSGPKSSSIPEDFFPYPDYQVNCSTEVPGDFPSGVSDRFGSWRLITLCIELRGNDGKTLGRIEVDKIVSGTDL